jgi:ankyrin repeat protein
MNLEIRAMRMLRRIRRRISLAATAVMGIAAISLMAASACSTLPASQTGPRGRKVIDMVGYRVTVPRGGEWQAAGDRESGTVTFTKKWGGFLRWLTDEQRRAEIALTSIQVPFDMWSMAGQELTSALKDGYIKEVGIHSGGRWEVIGHGGKPLYYLRSERFVDGDEESTGLKSLNDEPNYKESALYCLYFPPDIDEAHRYFEVFLRITSIDSILALHKDPERPTIEAIVDGLEIVSPLEGMPGPTGALFRASAGGDREAVLKALELGADINADFPGLTPLALAASFDRRDIADLLIREESLTDAFDGGKAVTPFLAALVADKPEIAAVLLEKGGRMNDDPGKGFSALTLAAALEYPALVSLLIEKGADVNSRTGEGKTPLMFASGSGSVESARVLLDKGAGVDVQASDGGTALMMAVDGDRPEMARFLLDQGADIDIRDENGWSCLLVAVGNGDGRLAGELIERGADINANIYASGETPLLMALRQDEFEIAGTLIKAGANVNLRKDGQRTALMVAAEKGQSELVALLIARGGDVNARTDDGQTALKIAQSHDQARIADLLINAGAKKSFSL